MMPPSTAPTSIRTASSQCGVIRPRPCEEWYHSRVDLGGLLTGDALISLVTLTAMEIVLGIDNVVFIAILVGRLPAGQQTLGRRLGLILALRLRIGLPLPISWIMGLTEPLFTVFGGTLSGRDLILIGGG